MASDAGPKPLPGAFDFSALQQALNDPAIKQMAEQIASDPAFSEVMKTMQTSFASMMGPGFPVPDGTETRAPGEVPDPSFYMNAMTSMFDNPEFMQMAEKLGQDIIQNDPSMDQMMKRMQDPNQRAQIEDALFKMREDPDLKPLLAELETGGPMIMIKYWNNPEVLSKLGVLMGTAFSFPDLDVIEELEEEEDGNATVHSTASAGDGVRLEELIEAGANVDEVDEENRTALHFACGYGELECAQILIDAKANMNAFDNNRNTCLHYAAGYGQVESIRLLLKCGADVSLVNVDGKTALDVAVLNDKQEVIAALKGE